MENTLLEENITTLMGYRMSPQQKQVWQAQQQARPLDATPDYYAQIVIGVNGDVEPEMLRAAATAVVERHEILRTSFPRQPGLRTPVQVIHEEASLGWREEDFSAETSNIQASLVEAVIKDERCERVAEAERAVLRLTMVRLSGPNYRVILTLPALCADDASLGIIAKEIFQIYAAPPQSERASDPPVQYIQFSEWQNELAESEDADTGRAFWIEQQTAPALTFPNSVSSSASREDAPLIFVPQRLCARLSRHVSTQLDGAASRCGVSTQTMLLACWQVLLWRLTAQENFSVDCVFDGRQYRELEGAVGLFARALPLSCRIDGQQTFRALAHEVEQRRQQVIEWQEYFDSENDEVTARGDRVGYEYVECDAEWAKAGSLEWQVLEQRSEIQRPKLGLRCRRFNGVVEMELLFDAKSYAEADVERLLERMQRVVESAVESVTQTISNMSVVSEREWKYLVDELSQTAEESSAPGEQQSIVEMFEAIARKFAGRVAVVGEDKELNYGELNGRANQLAHYLRRLGVMAETPVAICLERSAEMVVALLGVLKAGGAYVPLDLTYSGARLSFMLEDAAPLIVLTQQKLLAALPAHPAQNVCLDSNWDIIARESRENPDRVTADENLAYVIYTSGSTGTPKGVGIEHRQLQNYLRGIRQRLDLPDGGHYATVSTFAADLGNTAIFPSLSTGGCLHVISQERATNPDGLADYFSQHKIDCLKIVPSHLEALLATPEPTQVLPRRRLVLGGEAARPEMIRRIQELVPDCRIMNHYGPTETTVGVLTYAAENDVSEPAAAALPLGRPLAETQIYLLAANLAPVPFGVAGELYIGGESLARGYFQRPDLTAERFVPNPFGARPGTRLYRTGDVARYLPDGNVEFIGRNDNQVKIRGYRVELGEIECALLQHASVREAVVITREDPAGGKRLAAYLVNQQNQVPSADELQRFLKNKLPEYMIPSVFVLLKSLPLNPNGKLDRRELPGSEGAGLQLNGSFIEPRTTVEEVLAAMWADVLKQERVGVEDNFFALGGHSLAAMQVMSRVRNTFHVELPLRAVFEATTVALLAEAIAQHEPQPGQSERIARVLKKLQSMSPAEKEALMIQKKSAGQLVGIET